jgi:hypothetical protein
MDFGIDCTGSSSLIRNKLKFVKHVVWDMACPNMDVVPLIKTINYVSATLLFSIMTSLTSHFSISFN